jgi:hypothetical protein
MKAIIAAALMTLLATPALAQDDLYSTELEMHWCKLYSDVEGNENRLPVNDRFRVGMCVGRVLSAAQEMGRTQRSRLLGVKQAIDKWPEDRKEFLSYNIEGVDVEDLRPRYEVVECPPNSLSFLQAVRVVLKHLNQHPEEMHRGFELLIREAFNKAWPCHGPGK